MTTVEPRFLDYLKSASPLAQKVGEDVEKIVHSNQEKWSSLDLKSKDKIINQSLIDESLVKKYERKLDQEDEEYYEELSTFSWFTRSQLNLFNFIETRPDRSRTPMKKTQDVLSPLKKGKVSGAGGAVVKSGDGTVGRTAKGRPKDEKTCPRKPKTPPPPPPAKLKTPPPPPPAKLRPAEQKASSRDAGANPDDIPKTGFDFLDNW